MQKTFLIGAVAGVLLTAISFALGWYINGDLKDAEYLKQKHEAALAAIRERNQKEAQWIQERDDLLSTARRDQNEIQAKYIELIDSLSVNCTLPSDDNGSGRMQSHSSGASDNLPANSGTTARAQSTQTDKPSQPSCAVYKDSLKKAKARILYEAKEHDICATHYNTLLKIYQSVSSK